MPTPTICQPFANDLKSKEDLLAGLEAEYQQASGVDKGRLFYLVRDAASQVTQARAKLAQCLNPPAPLPDLAPTDFAIRFHPGGAAFDFAVLIHNEGAPVGGSFKITLGVEYYVYGQDPPLDVYREQDFVTPPSTWIQPGDTFTSEYFLNVPFITRTKSSMASYTFYALVDADDQVNESNKANNNLQLTKLLKRPLFVVPPFADPVPEF